jgi:integrase
MPKKQSASISLKMLKKEKDGKHPIVLRVCWKGQVASRYTNVWVEPKYWNGTEISKKCPDFAALNILLKKVYNEADGRRLDYEAKDMEYSAYDLVSEKEIPKCKLEYSALYNKLVEEKKLKSIQNYHRAYTKLKEYSHLNEIQLTMLTAEYLQGFANWLIQQGRKSGYAQFCLTNIRSVWNYAIKEKLVSPNDYPFGNNNGFWRKYKQGEHKTAITKHQLDGIIAYFCNTFYEFDGINNIIQPKKSVKYKSLYSYWFALNFWLTIYYMQGLSPNDVLNIKRSQIQLLKDENDEEYYRIVGVRRAKTGIQVPIAIKNTDIVHLLITPYYRLNDGEYLYPLFNHLPKGTSKDTAKNNLIAYNSKTLKILWQRINKYAFNQGWEDWEDIPRDTTLYSARHSFATHYLERGGNVVGLATMLGRRVANIDVYVKQLTSDDYILNLKKDMII